MNNKKIFLKRERNKDKAEVIEILAHSTHALEALMKFTVLFEDKYLLEEVYGIK